MRITNEIVSPVTELGGRDDAMAVFLQPSAWDELQTENPPQLDVEGNLQSSSACL